MTPRVHPALASQHYRSLEIASRVDEANPHALVGLLYEELLGSLDVVIAKFAREPVTASNAHVTRARSILVALEGSLDFDKGGALAPVLARVYRAAGRELSESVASGNTAKLTELRTAISNIAFAWASLGSA
jgi:flagellar secretion chaperone FliS